MFKVVWWNKVSYTIVRVFGPARVEAGLGVAAAVGLVHDAAVLHDDLRARDKVSESESAEGDAQPLGPRARPKGGGGGGSIGIPPRCKAENGFTLALGTGFRGQRRRQAGRAGRT